MGVLEWIGMDDLRTEALDAGVALMRQPSLPPIAARATSFEGSIARPLLGRPAVYARLEGTMYRPMHAASRMLVVRERTLILQRYLELLEAGP